MKVLIEIEDKHSELIKKLIEEGNNDISFPTTRQLEGEELFKMIIENAHSYVALIISIIALFKKSNLTIKVILKGGKRIDKLTKEEIVKVFIDDTDQGESDMGEE